MPNSTKKSSEKKNAIKKSTSKPNEVSNTSQNTITNAVMDDILNQIQNFVTEFRNDGGKGALISNNLTTNRDSDPFHILISCIFSLRTKDTVTEKITEKLYSEVSTPEEFLSLNE